MLRPTTIFGKLFYTFIGIILISFLLFTSISYFIFKNDIEARHDKTMDRQLDTVLSVLHKAEQEGWSSEVISSTLDLIVSHSNQNNTFYFFDAQGRLLYDAGVEIPDFFIEQALVEQTLTGQTVREKLTVSAPERERVFIVGFPLDTSSQERAVMIVSHDMNRDVQHTTLLLLLAIIPTILVVAVMIFLISKRITTPLKRMSEAARSIAEGDLKQRVAVQTKDEIGKLGETFNVMAQELESVETMRRDFIANVSHDLRTPLTSLHGFLTALADETIPKEKEGHYLKIMKEQTERQIKLVADLLDLATLEGKQFKINPRPFNFSEEVRKIIGRMDPELTRSKVGIQLITDEDEDIMVFADRDRIEQVIMNLIQNAIQFSPGNSMIDVTLESKGEYAVFSVRDYGPGIKKENLKYIWQRFYKEDEARRQKVGTGIGLSIAKQILELHHTTIQVESEEGRGATFTFKLPRH